MLRLLFITKKTAKRTDLCLIWHETVDTLLFSVKVEALYMLQKSHQSYPRCQHIQSYDWFKEIWAQIPILDTSAILLAHFL